MYFNLYIGIHMYNAVHDPRTYVEH